MVEVPPQTPAQRADLRPGDQLVRVDGKELAGRSSEQVQELLSGEVGSTAAIEVLRDGRRLTLEIVREPYTKKGAGP